MVFNKLGKRPGFIQHGIGICYETGRITISARAASNTLRHSDGFSMTSDPRPVHWPVPVARLWNAVAAGAKIAVIHNHDAVRSRRFSNKFADARDTPSARSPETPDSMRI